MSLRPSMQPTNSPRANFARRLKGRRGRRARQGVVLLLVVTLLVMFLLIGVTGVIVATTYYSGSKAMTGLTRAEIRYEDFSDRAMMQLLRGTDARSSMWGHDMLADLYGIDSYLGTVQGVSLDPQTTNPGPPATSPILKFVVTITNRFDNQTTNTQRFFEPDFFAGRFFTLMAPDGSPKEPTVRILRSDVVDLTQLHSDQATLGAHLVQYMLVIDNDRNAHADAVADADGNLIPDGVGFRFMISGAPYNGTGAGYKAASGWTASNGRLNSAAYPNPSNPNDVQPYYSMNQVQPFDIDQDGDPLGTPDLQVHTVLLPNHKAYSASYPVGMFQDLAPFLGGQDESWDAADLQNLFLSRIDTSDANTNGIPDFMETPWATNLVIPSFHRYQLYGFLNNVFMNFPALAPYRPNGARSLTAMIIDMQAAIAGNQPQESGLTARDREVLRLIRSSCLRPLIIDHIKGQFTGSNQTTIIPTQVYDNTTSAMRQTAVTDLLLYLSGAQIPLDNSGTSFWRMALDVDTDGDQIKDAIWIDPGFPVQQARDGRRYKVMAAIKVEDLNARINLNTGMNEALAYQSYQQMQSPAYNTTSFFAGSAPMAPSGSGGGFGGSEISIPLPNGANFGNLQEIMGIPPSMVPSGGPSGTPGRYGPLNETPLGAVPGGSVGADLLLTMRAAQFVSAEQVFGVRQIALDHDGQPLFAAAINAGAPRPFLAAASPYRFNPLYAVDPNDDPYRNTEIESQVRTFDSDAVLMDERIQGFLQKLGPSDLIWAKNVTNLSLHIPVAGQLPQKEYRQNVETYTRGSITAAGFAGFMSTAYDQLYIANQWVHKTSNTIDPSLVTPTPIEQKHLALVLVDQMDVPPGNAAQLALARTRARADFKSMIPFELRHGHAMDVNRPFGNGYDDNSAGTGRVDENLLMPRGDGTNYDLAPEDYNAAASTVDPVGRFAYGSPAVQLAMTNANVGYSANSHFLNDLPDLTFAANHIRPAAPYVLRYATDPRQYYARHLFVLAYLSLRTDPTSGNKFLLGFDNPALGLTPVEQREMVIRRLAQWAVNVADFRDPDSVMTCFEYDLYPENGWDCDGDPRTIEPVPAGSPFAGDPQGERRVVWGCERPELLLNESLALHDRCVQDTAQGGNRSVSGDQELDQVKFPQASLYLELFCPRPRALGNATVQPGDFPTDLYAAGPSLDLSRMAPAAPDGTRQRPVWRIVISETVNVNGTAKTMNKLVPEDYFQLGTNDAKHFRVTYQPEAMLGVQDGVGGAMTPQTENLAIEREIWFAPVDLNETTNPGAMALYGISSEARKRKIFYNRSAATTSIQPGKYLVIGPRTATYVGTGSSQQITFTPPQAEAPQVSVQVYNTSSNPPPAWGGPNAVAGTHPSLGPASMGIPAVNLQNPGYMVCASLLPDDPAWAATTAFNLGALAGNQHGVGLNISYTIADIGNPYWSVSHMPDQADDSFTTPPDLPFDNDSASQLVTDGVIVVDPTSPSKSTGTQLKYKVAFLQRLADPNLPYNPMPPPAGSMVTQDPDNTHRPELPVNPYITVDSMSLDLTVFNGSEAPHQTITGMAMTQHWDTADRYVDPAMDAYDPNDTGDDAWRIGTAPTIRFATREKGAIDPITMQPLFWTPASTDPSQTIDKTAAMTYGQELDLNAHFDFNLKHSLGYMNESLGGLSRMSALTGPEQIYNGSPSTPFAWLAWANAPYSSAYEVMMVPASGPNRLLHEMGDVAFVALADRTNFYIEQPAGTANPVTNAGQFTYLLNFFRSQNATSAGATAPELGRMLELLTTPNQFVGSDRWYRPASMPAPNTNVGNTPSATIEATHDRRAPFNYVPQFREAGRINLNTTQQYVWQNGIAANFPEHFLNNRGAQVGATITSNPPGLSPEFFNNPLRPADASGLLPDYTSLYGPPMSMGYTSASAGLLRGQNPAAPIPADPTGPVFGNLDMTNPAVSSINPGFRYQGISRLANTTTNQANAFAVWITLGKFEVSYVGPSAASPDGYTLGTELGFDGGTQQRHRSFFIIDRTAPVAYETGKNNNTSNCILLRRVLE